jgi:hypothetical protein
MKDNIKYEGWELSVDGNSIEVSKDGEHRVYDLDGIESVVHSKDYVILDRGTNGFYQVKFEENNFLVIDEFDEYHEFIDSIANYVFNE